MFAQSTGPGRVNCARLDRTRTLRAMIRQLMAGLTVAAIASAAMAQSPYPFRWQPAVVPAGGWRADNPLVLLGQKLFFDTRLSTSGRTACASCHNPDYAYAQP